MCFGAGVALSAFGGAAFTTGLAAFAFEDALLAFDGVAFALGLAGLAAFVFVGALFALGLAAFADALFALDGAAFALGLAAFADAFFALDGAALALGLAAFAGALFALAGAAFALGFAAFAFAGALFGPAKALAALARVSFTLDSAPCAFERVARPRRVLALDGVMISKVWNLPNNPILSGERFTYPYQVGRSCMKFQLFSGRPGNPRDSGDRVRRNSVAVSSYAAREGEL